MNRKEYLENDHVAGFVQWLRAVIVSDQGFNQSFSSRNGQSKEVISLTSFCNAVEAYNFGQKDLGETQIVLDEMALSLKSAMDEGGKKYDIEQQHLLLISCLNILVWGGVTVKVTIEWLANRALAGALHESIRSGTQALLSDSVGALDVFKKERNLRSDSAATKLYALADGRSIIYDNRVGAALAKLVCEYLDHGKIKKLPDKLAFMVDGSPGRRNPSVKADRKFTRKKAGYKHAVWNQRANWIMSALVDDPKVVSAMKKATNVNAIRAIEAALFVMGDDIRTLNVSSVKLDPFASHFEEAA